MGILVNAFELATVGGVVGRNFKTHNEVQLLKPFAPMDVTDAGISILGSEYALKKPFAAIEVVPSGIFAYSIAVRSECPALKLLQVSGIHNLLRLLAPAIP